MPREYIWAAVSFVLVAVVGVGLLYFASTGALPTGFGLFDQSQWSVRAITFVILAVVAGLLYLAYRNSSRAR
ncbi:MAG TPA: hypothetical protein VFN71_13555 [Methylomirabilota bacterium]|nr:hypothetical protein [Methylomirabilota bacterium]